MTGTELGMVACMGDEAITWISTKLERAGLRVYRSFDLRTARNFTGTCSCSYHGSETCDCEMVILLVYQEAGAPATVVLHGHRGRTWMLLGESPNESVESAIMTALAPAQFDHNRYVSVKHGET